MKVLVTGAAGRIGRVTCQRLAREHRVVGLDQAPSPTTDIVADLRDTAALRAALAGVDAVVHMAALHAPHVGRVADEGFHAVNVQATETLARLAAEVPGRRFVFTSTTALYGAASTVPGRAAWIDEDTVPQPRTVYHRSKLQAEHRLEAIARETGLPVTVIRMARCFPEPAPAMAVYRLHRGVDARDVADVHALAATSAASGFRRFVVSGRTPFLPEDAERLGRDAPAVIALRCPALAAAFARRGWPLPSGIDRVYAATRASADLGWTPAHGFESVLEQFDGGGAEVLRP